MPNEDQEANVRQRERWDRAITVSILVVIGSGILAFAAQEAMLNRPMRYTSPVTACGANLKSIDGAKSTWALENQKNTKAIPTDADLFGPTAYLREKPTRPANGIYTLGSVGQKPRCSIPGHTI